VARWGCRWTPDAGTGLVRSVQVEAYPLLICLMSIYADTLTGKYKRTNGFVNQG
jgi:hypothetical protein